jgi:ferredoxin
MRVRVDHQRCFGYGRCVDLVPEVFTLDENDHSVAGGADGVELSRLTMAVWACPMQAITLVDDDSREPQASVVSVETPQRERRPHFLR